MNKWVTFTSVIEFASQFRSSSAITIIIDSFYICQQPNILQKLPKMILPLCEQSWNFQFHKEKCHNTQFTVYIWNNFHSTIVLRKIGTSIRFTFKFESKIQLHQQSIIQSSLCFFIPDNAMNVIFRTRSSINKNACANNNNKNHTKNTKKTSHNSK